MDDSTAITNVLLYKISIQIYMHHLNNCNIGLKLATQEKFINVDSPSNDTSLAILCVAK